jgi:hypothetical protein
MTAFTYPNQIACSLLWPIIASMELAGFDTTAFRTLVPNDCPIPDQDDDDDDECPPWTDWTPPFAVIEDSTGWVHHIPTNKHEQYWKPIFVAMFAEGGLN